MPERAVTLPNGCEQHGVPAYRDDAGTVHIATGARCVGPDAERDERVRLRRAADARRAGQALDRLLHGSEIPNPNHACAEHDDDHLGQRCPGRV